MPGGLCCYCFLLFAIPVIMSSFPLSLLTHMNNVDLCDGSCFSVWPAVLYGKMNIDGLYVQTYPDIDSVVNSPFQTFTQMLILSLQTLTQSLTVLSKSFTQMLILSLQTLTQSLTVLSKLSHRC